MPLLGSHWSQEKATTVGTVASGELAATRLAATIGPAVPVPGQCPPSTLRHWTRHQLGQRLHPAPNRPNRSEQVIQWGSLGHIYKILQAGFKGIIIGTIVVM